MIAGRKLLLADDSAAIQKVIDLTFTDEGMEVTTVGDGQDALDKLNQFTPDVVLADVFMPGVDGYELCKFIKGNERFRGVPVMLLVGSFEPFDEGEAKRAGADDVVTKPFQSIRELVSRVGSLVSREDESADKHSVLGLTQTEGGRQEAEGSRQEILEAAAEQPNVKVFVEAPVMDTEPPVAEEHTCPSDIELQTADTQQLEPIAEATETMTAEADAQFEDTLELEVVEDSGPAQVEAATFDEEGVLDLGDIDSFAAATVEDDFELEIDVEPVASLNEAVATETARDAYASSESHADMAEQSAEPAHDSLVAAATDEATSNVGDLGAETFGKPAANLSPAAIEAISRRVVEQLSDKVVREIAWEVVPELSELLIKKRLEEKK